MLVPEASRFARCDRAAKVEKRARPRQRPVLPSEAAGIDMLSASRKVVGRVGSELKTDIAFIVYLFTLQ